MNAKDRSFDLAAAHVAVQRDTTGVLGAFLDGASNWRTEKSEFFVIRWRFEGRHARAIAGFGHTSIKPTFNTVTVSGLTLVENTVPGQSLPDDIDELLKSNTIVFQRFVDWLAVFAQIGVLHLGRPMSIADIRFVAPDRGKSRRPGYNDEQGDA